MNTLVPWTFVVILLVSACTRSQQDKVDAQSRAVAPAKASVHSYRCESGETIVATYPSTDFATVRYRDSTYKMEIAVSGSGVRYVGREFEWWTKGSGPGSEGTLFRHQADGTSGESIETCTGS